jgi:trehalose 2-sulfotransferase
MRSNPSFPIPYARSSHESRLIEHFGEGGVLGGDSPSPERLRSYVICFTNRCGSNLLAELVSSNPQFGKAGEYLNAGAVVKVSSKRGFNSLQQYLAWLHRAKASGAGILGLKLAYPQLFFLVSKGLMPAAFGDVRFVHIRRRDVLAQAVSFYISARTEAWTSKHASRAGDMDLPFDEKSILRMMNNIHEANAKLRCFFDVYGIQPVDVLYEDLVNDLQGTGDRVARELGFPGVLEPTVQPRALTLKKQANALNADFVARFRERFPFTRADLTGAKRRAA